MTTVSTRTRSNVVSATWALSRLEGRRLVRHPAVLVGLAFGAALLINNRLAESNVPTGFEGLRMLAIPLAVGTFIAANLGALRNRRHGTAELYEAEPLSARHRTAAHLLSVLWAVAVAVLVAGLTLVTLSVSGGLDVGFVDGIRHRTPTIVEVALGPTVVGLFGVVGILMARWIPSVFIPLLAVVAAFPYLLIEAWTLAEGPSGWYTPLWSAAVEGGLLVRSRWWKWLLPDSRFRRRRLGLAPCVSHRVDRHWISYCACQARVDASTLPGWRRRSRRRGPWGGHADRRCHSVAVMVSRTDGSRERGRGRLASPRWSIGRRLDQIELLFGQKARLVQWKPMAGAAAVGFFVLYQSSGAWATGMPAIIPLRMAALLLCLGAVFLLDDPAAVTVASVPSPLRYRRSLRVLLVSPIVAAAWIGQLVYVFVHTTNLLHRDTEGLLPVWGLTLEMVAMMLTGLAIAALSTRWVPEGLGGVAAGPTLLVLLGAAMFLPGQWSLFVGSVDDPQWVASHIRWAVIAVVATLILMYGSRDPAARRPRGLRGRASSHGS